MLRTMRSRESRMREIRTYGLMRERASLAEPSLLYFSLFLPRNAKTCRAVVRPWPDEGGTCRAVASDEGGCQTRHAPSRGHGTRRRSSSRTEATGAHEYLLSGPRA